MTHTAQKMIVAVGQIVNVRVESWTVPMRVVDAKSAWGNIRETHFVKKRGLFF